MTTLSIQPPFPLITDIDGQPLEDGYIWIGAANLPPIGNPIAVYWDAALTIPAALPIRTRGGYPVNAGTPARLYVGSDYSILVQNKNGSTLYSAPDGASDRFSAAQIAYMPAGTGAVATTVQAKLRETVSVRDFGAVGDGVADDTAAIQAAIDANVPLRFTSGTYKVTGSLSFASSAASPKVLNWQGDNGATITFSGGGTASFVKTNQAPCQIAGIAFTSDGNANTSFVFDVAAGRLTGCSFTGFGNALKIAQAYIEISHNLFKSNTVGLMNIDGVGRYCNSNSIFGNTFANNGTGILLSDATNAPGLTNFYSNNIYIENNTFENNTSNAIALTNFQNVAIEKNWFEGAAAPIQNIIATNCRNLFIDNVWTQYTASYAVKLDASMASIGAVRGTKFTLANSSLLYFTVALDSQAISITKDGTSQVFRENLRVNGATTFYGASRAGVTLTPQYQNHDTTQEVSNMNIRWAYDGVPVGYIAGQSKSGTVGSYTPMDTGNTLGAFMFAGAGATKLLIPAQVSAAAQETFTDATAATSIQFWTTPTGSVNPIRRLEIQPDGHLYPYADNTYTLGGASNRWTTVYATTPTINTSDANEKQDISNLDAAEKRVAAAIKGLIKKFKFKDAVQLKGDAARIHVGVIAQEVMDAFQAEGLDPMLYAIVCYDEWEDRLDEKGNKVVEAGSRYGIRYEELLAFIIAAL